MLASTYCESIRNFRCVLHQLLLSQLIPPHSAMQIREPRYEKTGLRGFRPGTTHKPGCAITEDGKSLEISDLDRRVIVLSV